MALTKVKTDVIESLDAAKITGLLSAIDGTNLDNVTVGSDQVSRNNLALNVFEDSVRHNMDRLSLSQGWVDTFEDADDVDGGRHYNIPMTYFSNTPTNSTNTVYLSQDANQFGSSGWADSQKLMFSFYMSVDFDSDSSNSNDMDMITCGSNNYVLIRREGFEQTNKIHVQLKNASSQVVVRARSTKTVLRSDGVVHVLISLDTTQSDVAKRFQMIITESDGTKHSGIDTSFGGYVAPVQNGIVKLTDKWGIATPAGATGGGTTFFKGSLGQIFSAEDAMDISDDNNYGIFYSPNDFGNGEVPFGTTDKVRIHLKNQYPTFRTGTGQGSFIQQGNLELVDGGYANDETYSSKSFSNSYEVVDSYGMENYESGTFYSMRGPDSGGGHHQLGICRTTASDGEVIHGIAFYADEQTNAVSGNVTAIITKTTGTIDTNAVSDGDIIASSIPLNASTWGTTPSLRYFTFPEPVALEGSTDYFFGMNFSDISGDNVTVWADSSSPNSNSQTAYLDFNNNWQHATNVDVIFYLYGNKNLDLITKGSDDIGNSPSAAPTKGHMEVLMTERPASGTDVGYSVTLDTDSDGSANTSTRVIVSSSDITTGGDRIRVTFAAGSTEGLLCDHIAIVERVGDTMNGTTIPTEIKFGGTSGAIAPAGGTITSDWTDYKLRTDRDYLLIMDVGNNSSLDNARYNPTTGNGYYGQGIANTYHTAAGTNTGGKSTGTLSFTKIEVENKQTLNTDGDIIGQMSRDGGSTWDDVSLTRTETQVSGTNRNLLGGEVTFAATTGTNIVGRVKTANKDKITVHGISVNWS